MPPANSRATSPPAHEQQQDPVQRAGTPPTAHSYLSALRELESPVNSDVLNLAATLTTQAEDDHDHDGDGDGDEHAEDPDDHDAASLRYLRQAEHDEWRIERTRERLRQLERQRDDIERRDRLRRVMNRLSRIHEPPAYGDRVPSQNNLYDWSPANEADDEDELDQILQELRREQPNTHPEILRVLGRSQLDAERESRIRAYSSRLLNSNQPSQSAESSLRSAAILQSVRRHPRFASSRRGFEYAFPPEREPAARSTHYPESRDRYSSSESARQGARHRLSELHSSLDQDRERDRDMLGRVDSYRRSYLERSSNTPPTASPLLEQTIKYLSRIRYSTTVEDSLDSALDAGFLNKDYFCEENPDFILDTYTLPPPAQTSWLAPGAVLNGCQHATTVTSTVTSAGGGTTTTLYRFRNNDTLTSTLFDSSRPWLSHNYTSPHRRSITSAGPDIVTSHAPSQDRWPVKVTIHAVDYSKMSLSATMEAYNVPSHPHSHQSLLSPTSSNQTPFTRTSSITTYLEGEILDFNTHTLLTESFKSSPGNDATYWRKLPPFQKFSDEELCRNLVSKRWFEEVLSKEWVLMRWKERCFVKSLNRSTSHPVMPTTTNNGFGDRSAFGFGSATASDMSAGSTSAVLGLENRSMPDALSSNRGHWQPWTGVNNSSSTQHSNVNSNSSSAMQNQTQSQSQSQQQDLTMDRSGESEVFDDSGCGLTISGFYYVCLRRSDGRLEGLYYDPQSSPYQHLKLESVNGGNFAAWRFR